MKVTTKSIYAYEVDIKTRSGRSEPIFTFSTSIRLEGTENETPIRLRVRAYYANFPPHSPTPKLSTPGPWTEWSSTPEFDEAAGNLDSQTGDNRLSDTTPTDRSP